MQRDITLFLTNCQYLPRLCYTIFMDDKVRNNLTSSLLMVVIVFAIITLIAAALTLDKINDIRCQDQIVINDCIESEYLVKLDAFDMSAVVVKPKGWSFERFDAGTVSSFVFTDSEYQENKIAIIFHQPVNYDTGERVSFEQWLLDNGYAIAVSHSIIGKEKIAVDFYPSVSLNYENSLVGRVPNRDDIFFEISTTNSTFASSALEKIKNSFELQPNSEVVNSAISDICKKM